MKPSDSFGLLAFLHWNHPWNNHHFPPEILDKALLQLKDLGVPWLRIDILWSDVHCGYRQYDFSRYDEIIKKIYRHGFRMLAVLQYNKTDRLEEGKKWNSPPESFDEFAAYVGATVSHFKNQISHFEIWNEPNVPIYWLGPQDGLKTFIQLLSLSYKAAKRANPHCDVLNGGLTADVAKDVESFYQNGGKSWTDIVNIHTFANPVDPVSPRYFDRLLQTVQTTMNRYGDPFKKIWITEMGCPGLPPDKLHLGWFASGPGLNETIQANWLEKQYRMIEAHPRVEKLFWAFYRDTDHEFGDATDYMGLVRLDLSPKPAFHRFKKLLQNDLATTD